MRPLDTTPDEDRVYRQVIRDLGGERRLAMAFEMSDNARAIAESGVRSRHPEYTEDEVRRAMLWLMQGREIYRMVYPDRDIQP